MGGPSERDYKEKLGKIRENLYKKLKDVRDELTKIEKIKTESLKKTEEYRRSAEKDAFKIEEEIMKSKDLAPESKNRLRSEIAILRKEIEEKSTEVKTRVSATLVPA